MRELIASIQYISQVSTRGFWGWLVSNEITTAADNVGRVAGSWVGRSAGCLTLEKVDS